MAELYFIPIKDIVCLQGTVSSDPIEPFMDVYYQGAATGTSSIYGTSGAPIVGNTVEFSQPNGAVLGRIRLRGWDHGLPTGYINVAENDDFMPLVKAGDTIRVYQRFDPFAVSPRPVKIGGVVTLYEDYDVAYTDQTDKYPPVAVAGIPSVSFLENGTATANFYGNHSYAVASGASISSWLWTADGSVEGTSSAEGTDGIPVVFTFTQPGQYLVSLQVSDTNGKAHTAYTWALVVNPDEPEPIAYTNLGKYSDTQDYRNGGGSASISIYGVADSVTFPDSGMVVVAARGDDIVGGVHPAQDRDNILFVGYIKNGTISYSYEVQTLSLKLQTIDGVMRQIKTFPVSLHYNSTPSTWLQAKDLCADNAAIHFLHWRSTVLNITPYFGMNYDALIVRQDFNGGDAYSEIDRLYQDAWGHVAGDARGWLVGERDYQLMTTGTERASTDTGIVLTKDDWLNSISITEVGSFGKQTSRVSQDGVYFSGSGDPVPLFSTAPGDIPKDFGREVQKSGLILTTQEDLNVRCGLALAKETMKYPSISTTFINDVRFFTSPQRRFKLVIEAADNLRGLEWTATVVPRHVSRRYVPSAGYFLTQVRFEPDAVGAPGVTVTMPAMPVVPGGGEPTASGTSALVAAGSLWVANENMDWQQSGVTGSVYSLLADPYIGIGGVPPNIWYGGDGFIRWTDVPLSGYTNVTPTGTPLNVWGDTSVPDFNNVKFSHAVADVTAQGSVFAVAQWDESGGNHRFEIIKSNDGGLTWFDGYWWMANGLSPSNVYGAYNAVGATDYNDSLVNRNAPGVNDLTTGVAPDWAATTGWQFDAATTYINTGFLPTSNMTVIVSTARDASPYGYLLGAASSVAYSFYTTAAGTYTEHFVHATNLSNTAAAAVDIVLAGASSTSSQKLYVNGSLVDSASVSPQAVTVPIYIGAYNNNGVAYNFYSERIKAIAIYTVELSAAQIATISENMARIF